MCGSPYKVGHTTVLHSVGKMNDLKIYFRRNNPLTIYIQSRKPVYYTHIWMFVLCMIYVQHKYSKQMLEIVCPLWSTGSSRGGVAYAV